MHSLVRDPLQNAIYGEHGIKRGIEACFDNGCYGSGLILIFAGIDALSNLTRPESATENTSLDFKNWVRRYIKLSGDIEVTPDDLWGARCAIVHTYGQSSRDTKSKKARVIAWIVEGRPCVRYNPSLDPDFAAVDTIALKDSFFEGIDKFLIDVFSIAELKSLVEPRLPHILTAYPWPKMSTEE